MNDQQLHEHCIRWVEWRRSSYIYTPADPGAEPIQFYPLPEDMGEEEIEELEKFDVAVSVMRNKDEYKEISDCFWLFYVKRVVQIKMVAKKMGIARSTFYGRVKKGARIAYEIRCEMEKEKEEINSRLRKIQAQ